MSAWFDDVRDSYSKMNRDYGMDFSDEAKQDILTHFVESEVERFKEYFPDAHLSGYSEMPWDSKNECNQFGISFSFIDPSTGSCECFEAQWSCNITNFDCATPEDIIDGEYRVIHFINPVANIDIFKQTAENFYYSGGLRRAKFKLLYSSEFALATKLHCSPDTSFVNEWVTREDVRRGDDRYFYSVEDFIKNADINYPGKTMKWKDWMENIM